MRCLQCGYTNPERNKFCGMCGSKIELPVIDDSDPLDLEHLQEIPRSLKVSQRAADREFVRDTSNGASLRRSSMSAIKNLPPSTVEEDYELESHRKGGSRSTAAIAGPSFLGLSEEPRNDHGFVYDAPRKGAFVYDNDDSAPEYLLEDVPRGVSWRAWALFALLLVGAGLGYIQWQASHNQGPDIATILARNGATVDPSGPVMTGNNAKPAAKKSDGAEAAKADAASDEAAKKPAENTDASTSNDSKDQPDAKATGDKPAEKNDIADAKSADSDEAKALSSSDSDEAAKPESDGPEPKAAKAPAAKLAAVEREPAAPKPLGDKDPLIIQAERYLQGRGVRQDCGKGINLLHQAMSAGNPAADVKMGALYWSGTCVTQSNVTAYQWFSRAHSLEPQNRWIERSRNSLWARMSSDEKRRVSY